MGNIERECMHDSHQSIGILCGHTEWVTLKENTMHDSHQSIGILCDHTEWVTLKESACMIATSP